ncbi:MAG: peroxiredoxin-like family protein [Pseudomonadota bacterium]
MTLTQQLDDYKKEFSSKVPSEAASLMQQATKDLASANIVDKAPKKGEKLLPFSLANHQGQQIELKGLLEKGPIILTFYRGGWCPYCNLELRAYQKVLSEIKALGANLVAVTPELPDASLSTIEKNALEFQVLSDVGAEYARALGLNFELPESLRPVYESFGISLEAHNGSGQFELPLAATFVIDKSGTIVSAFVDVDYTKRLEPEEAVSVLKALA